ncbi:MAG: serine/threonine-protein kinase [Chloroflexota bacterium]
MAGLLGKEIHGYFMEDFIGKGGHGAVYRATHVETEHEVAIKVMLPEHESDEILLKRLRQEAAIIRDLRHPHIVPLIEMWEDDYGIGIAMPYLSGGDLRQIIKRQEILTPEQLSHILNQICGALDAAHAAQIIHRDIKPENILLDENGNAYLTDFGVAKRMNRQNAITTVGSVIGSPNYLSPEQIVGAELSNRTDIYAIGILIYEMLAGEHPFAATTSRVKLMMQLVKEDFPDLDAPHISEHHLEEIQALITRCTSKDIEARYLTASSVAYHFARIIADNHDDLWIPVP